MQKSAVFNKMPARFERQAAERLSDKGQKFEPFWSGALFGADRRAAQRLQKADQKR
ncbi:hypothetical protein [Ideonella livida]|uniref:Uncharacterized protein n=1 Tax=Ideonella livida TaxID=2707176 RepID=A0A7C9PK04_9BURK|nr:hypothetical protein [Ideonella livida]NDY92970.1 hypothetical protein [Ideonella livida]